MEKEKSLGSGFPAQKTLKGAYDTSWSKRVGGYNALSGREEIIGFMTGNCINYGIKNKACKFCSKAEEKGQEPSKHDCRKKFSASAKAMEAQICEELLRKENYSVMIGDENSSCEARIRQNVNPDIQK